ncbi:hypothetical protein DUNSADRAFT_10901 [Dunaliella salina]|uniref:Encoded protein n=1 Tax=Dunaliella salina TaxID=3046 RepID=A0ABQ7H4Q4_DUNSA|nr:hypothetical protein DUNSADRAFT_10901 [Dunaliella salina]|eukprot:KAF5841838.1 hypothetical protein DUNSADRAFT_10901 [Dunaliella salina]
MHAANGKYNSFSSFHPFFFIHRNTTLAVVQQISFYNSMRNACVPLGALSGSPHAAWPFPLFFFSTSSTKFSFLFAPSLLPSLFFLRYLGLLIFFNH